MSCRQFCSAAVFVALVLASTSASAVRSTRIGQQYLTTGLSLTPGFVFDDKASGVGLNPATVHGGGTLRLGLQHWVAQSFVMAVEGELGPQWFDDNTAHSQGAADHRWAFGWQIGLMGRWVPQGAEVVPGERSGNFSAGLGLSLYRVHLDEVLQSLAAELRVGWYGWRKENFGLFELGYGVPFLQGLDLPTDFTGEGPPVVAQNWTLHRFNIGFSYGF